MNEVLAVALGAMQSDMARVEQVGMNLANAATTGYKRGVAVQAPVGPSFSEALAQASSGAAGAAVVVRTDSRPGTLKSTGHALDLAIAGKGYFEVATPQGPAYTRQGNFRLDAQSRLVTAQGYPVMGAGGEVNLASTQVIVSPAGVITATGSASDVPLAEIKLVEFDTAATPRPVGDGLVAIDGPQKVLPAQERQLRQGFLENSNVSPAYEMTQLVRAMRHFESMQRVAQGYDEMLGTAIRKLGEA